MYKGMEERRERTICGIEQLLFTTEKYKKDFLFLFRQICIVFIRNSAIVKTKMATTTHQDTPTILIVNTGKLPPTYQIIIAACVTRKL